MNKITLLLATVIASLATVIGCATKKVVDGKQDLIAQLLQNRFSGRSYDVTRAVSQAQLDMLVHAAQSTPSCYNMQPWNFIICNRATHAHGYKKIFDSLVEFNQGWAKDAPVLIVVVASKISPYNKQRNAHAEYDTGAAAFAMAMQATSLGLMAHQMGGFDADAIRASFQIPDEFEPMAVMAVGYSLETRAPKKERKPITDNFFFGEWKAAE